MHSLKRKVVEMGLFWLEMDEAGIFKEDANLSRVCTLFKIELQKR